MSWFQVDDAFNSHRKVAELMVALPFEESMMAHGVWLKAGANCAHRRDPSISFVQLVCLTACPRDAQATLRNVTRALCNAGLWSVTEDASEPARDVFTFVNWGQYNGTAEEKRSANAERQQRFRDAKREKALRVTQVTPVTQSNASSPHHTSPSPHHTVRSVREGAGEEVTAGTPDLDGFDAFKLCTTLGEELRTRKLGDYPSEPRGKDRENVFDAVRYVREKAQRDSASGVDVWRAIVANFCASPDAKRLKYATGFLLGHPHKFATASPGGTGYAFPSTADDFADAPHHGGIRVA